MSYSILNDRIRLYIDGEHRGFNVLFGENVNINKALQDCRGAWQNPDLSRVQLASLMRRGARKTQKSSTAQKISWDTFIASYPLKDNANCNNQELS